MGGERSTRRVVGAAAGGRPLLVVVANTNNKTLYDKQYRHISSTPVDRGRLQSGHGHNLLQPLRRAAGGRRHRDTLALRRPVLHHCARRKRLATTGVKQVKRKMRVSSRAVGGWQERSVRQYCTTARVANVLPQLFFHRRKGARGGISQRQAHVRCVPPLHRKASAWRRTG